MDSIQKHPGALESNVSDQLESSVKQALPQTTGKDTLTTLPVELQTISFKSLNVLDKLNLKFVNKYFYALIPQYSHADYLQVEQYTGAKGRFYACCICCRFRPRAKFSDNARIQTKGPGASKAKDRFCIECGLKPDSTGYTRLCRNTWLIINKEPWVVCYQCGNLGKIHKGNGTNWCEDCWRLDAQPRLETHANHVLPKPAKVDDQQRLGGTWISNYTTPQDIVQSAMLIGVSAPNAFAKDKKWDMNEGEGAASDNFHAREEDMVFTKKPIATHPKLITGKESKRGYRQRYRLPFMTRSEARKERAAARLEAVADHGLDIVASADDLVQDGDSNGGPGPSTLANATKTANLAAKADPTKDTDTPAPASVPQQKCNHAPTLLVTGVSAAQEGPSQHPNPKHPAHIPIWAQTATSQPNSQGLNPEALSFIPMSAIQVKSSRHPEAKGPIHIPIWATTQEGPIPHVSPGATHAQKLTTQASTQYLDCKDPQSLSTSAQDAATLAASTADTINAKDQREFAQPRFSIYDDMDMKPPCAIKITLNARSYSKKTAAPMITYKARGNSGNIIGMNYLKARQALHQLDPNRKLGWYTIRTVNLNTKAEVNTVRAKNLAGIRLQSDNSAKRRSNDDSLFELLLRKDRLPVDVDEHNKTRRIEEQGTEKEFKSCFSDRSSSSSPKPPSESTCEELRAKALATMNSTNPKKRKASSDPDAEGSKSAIAHYHNQMVENLQKKPRIDEESEDSFEGFSDSDSSWKGCED